MDKPPIEPLTSPLSEIGDMPVTRRSLLKRAFTAGSCVGLAASYPWFVYGKEHKKGPEKESKMSNSKPGYFVYVGSRTSKERNARGEGISVYQIDSTTSKWTLVQIAKDLVNPSFLTFDNERRVLYTVHGDKSEVSAFRVDQQSGRLDFINSRSTKGSNPVHLAVDASNKILVVANYATGTVVTLPIED